MKRRKQTVEVKTDGARLGQHLTKCQIRTVLRDESRGRMMRKVDTHGDLSVSISHRRNVIPG